MQTFKRNERLHGKKNIQHLFSQGKSYFIHPIKIYYTEREHNNDVPLRVLIAVSKKTIRKAVRRNLLKRRMREAYRRNKADFYKFLTLKQKQYDLGLVYIGKDLEPYRVIEKKIIQALERLIADYQSKSNG
jgi:ribonuclease P protein component